MRPLGPVLFLLSASTLCAPLLAGCSAAPGDEIGPDGPAASVTPPQEHVESVEPVGSLPWTSCPSSWCGASDACVSWTCERPTLFLPGQTFRCTPSYTAAGTYCADSTACVTRGACTGTGVCAPQVGGREMCATTPLGQADGYQCGGCSNGECSALRANAIEYPAPSWACTLVSE